MTETEIFSLATILQSCIDREKMSVRLYHRALEVVTNPAARKMIEMLRQEEVRHAQLLKEVLDHRNPELLGNDEQLTLGNSEITKSEARIDALSTPVDILKFAISHEEKSIEYFSRYVDTFRGTELGGLFARLKIEEEKHREKLQIELQNQK